MAVRSKPPRRLSAGVREALKQFRERKQQAARPRAYGPRAWIERWRDRLRRVRMR